MTTIRHHALTGVLVAAAVAAPAVDNGRGPVPVYEAIGSEVTGGDSLAAAAEVEPGIYRDVLQRGASDGDGEGTSRFYALPALEDGESLHVAAVLAVDSQQGIDQGGTANLAVDILNLEGHSCAFRASDYARAGSTDLPLVVTARSEVMDSEASYGCFADGTGRVAAKVTREGQWQADTPVPVELRFWVEPPVDETRLTEASSADLPPESVTVTGEAAELRGGSSFATATAIEPGQVYTAEIRPLDTQYFRVPVEYGQRLNYRVSTGDNQDSSVTGIDTSTFTPLLKGPRMVGGSGSLNHRSVGAVTTKNTAVAVSASEYGSHSHATLRVAGDYFIVVSAAEDRPRREGSQPFRYELAVSLTGEPGGTTEWVAAAPATQQAEQAGATSADGAPGRNLAADRGWLPTGTELAALLGGIGLGAVLVGLVWLALRRRNALD